jgi:Domain of unknown function (DUF4399)
MKNLTLTLAFLVTILFVSCGNGGHTADEKDTHHDDATEHAEMASNVAEMMAAPEGAHVFFENLEDGAVVSSPVKVVMGAEGITVQPAGEAVEGFGHHHIIINEGPTEYGTVVGADATHIHFGKGQTETELELEPGTYTITLQFADGLHRSYGEKVSTTISIEVQ